MKRIKGRWSNVEGESYAVMDILDEIPDREVYFDDGYEIQFSMPVNPRNYRHLRPFREDIEYYEMYEEKESPCPVGEEAI